MPGCPSDEVTGANQFLLSGVADEASATASATTSGSAGGSRQYYGLIKCEPRDFEVREVDTQGAS